MHILIFLGSLFGFILWESCWGYIGYKQDDSVSAGFFAGLILLLALGFIALFCWGLWNIT